jgi:hypothetical protein
MTMRPNNYGIPFPSVPNFAKDIFIIIALASFAEFMVDPRGDFPLNDDWSYGRAANILADTGEFRPTGWTGIPLIAHTVWGALLCRLFGCSYDTLRGSTLILSLFGVIAAYALIRQLHQHRVVALLAALTLCFNPIYFAMSNTYMSDVPFTFFALVSVFFFVRHLQNGSATDLLFGCALSVVAILSRQLAIFIPIAFGVVSLTQHKFSLRSIIRAAFPFVCCECSLLTFQYWMTKAGRLPYQYYDKIDRLQEVISHPKSLAWNLAHLIPVTILYLGLFMLPMLMITPMRFGAAVVTERASRFLHLIFVVLVLPSIGLLFYVGWLLPASLYFGLFMLLMLIIAPPRFNTWTTSQLRIRFLQLIFLLLVLSPIGLLFYEGWLMPLHRNVLIPSGIGPLTLFDTAVLQRPDVMPLPVWFWMVVTSASMIGGALLLANGVATISRIFPKPRDDRVPSYQAPTVFMVLVAIGILAPLLVADYFDRYLITLIPLLTAGVMAKGHAPKFRLPPFSFFTAIMCLLMLAAYSIAGTHDYLSWNRARWQALNDLLREDGVTAMQVDGGFEFNGLNFYDTKWIAPSDKGSWFALDNQYVISFAPIDGWEILRQYPYAVWMPTHTGQILVLRRRA